MTRSYSMIRALFAGALVLVAARFGFSGGAIEPERAAARLELVVKRGDSGAPTPARVYLFKDGLPFRFSPVDLLLPLRVDLFYRERLWRRPAEVGRTARTLEVTNKGDSHFVLLDGTGEYELPAGKYRVEAYRGYAWAPAVEEFVLNAGEDRRVTLNLAPLEGETAQGWISGDDHIHLTRAAEDDPVFLRWLEAEDLSVGNFLQLQRQVDAAVQYGFGRGGEARSPANSVRSGQESRSEFYGHVNMLGGARLVRPLSVGTMYANTPGAYPFPQRLFETGRSIGALVGYAHFDGSMKHSTLPLDLALGGVDFIEVFQFGVLKTDAWYQLLNAGFRVTGVAGSDFPANLSHFEPWPRNVALLGPERTLVKARGAPGQGQSVYDLWSEGVRRGAAVVTNGPLLTLSVDGNEPGRIIEWQGASKRVSIEARAIAHRPILSLEVIMNGHVIKSIDGDGHAKEQQLRFEFDLNESAWIAARVRTNQELHEPVIQAHTNPVHVHRDRRPTHDPAARKAILDRWKQEITYYRTDRLQFDEPAQRRDLETQLDEATKHLEREPEPWPRHLISGDAKEK